MPAMNIVLREPAWPDLQESGVHVHHTLKPIGVTCLEAGMQSGKPSVAFRIDLEDGTSVIAETSLVLFLTAADAFKAKYGDPR